VENGFSAPNHSGRAALKHPPGARAVASTSSRAETILGGLLRASGAAGRKAL